MAPKHIPSSRIIPQTNVTSDGIIYCGYNEAKEEKYNEVNEEKDWEEEEEEYKEEGEGEDWGVEGR